jgi:hypothetical protein
MKWRFLMKKSVMLLAVAALFSGCGHISGGVAPSNIPLAPNSYNELGTVRGDTCVYYLLGFIPLTHGNETKDAVNDALRKIPGTTALINVSADTYSQHFIVFSRMCTQIDGIAVKAK